MSLYLHVINQIQFTEDFVVNPFCLPQTWRNIVFLITTKLQYDLAQKLNDTRAKLAQTEIDLRPRNIDRSVAFEGTTETEELRDSRRQRLQGDRLVLQQNLKQFQSDLATNTEQLQEAQQFAGKRRRIYLPQMEREMTEQ